MKKLIIFFLASIFTVAVTANLFAQSSKVEVYTEYMIVADPNAPMKYKDGGYEPAENSTPTGELEMVVLLDGKKFSYTFKIIGSEKIGEMNCFKCDNDKYFYINKSEYVNQQVALPFNDGINNLPYQNFDEAIEAFKNDKSKELAWVLWLFDVDRLLNKQSDE